MKKTEIKDILSYNFLSGLEISTDNKKIAYRSTKANEEKNNYESNLFIYDINLDKNIKITDKDFLSIYDFDKDNNIIYKASSKDDFDYFYKSDGYGVGSEDFKIGLDVSSIKHLNNNLFLIKGADKKSKEEKEEDKKNDFFKEVDTLPFWFNGSGYLSKEDSAYYLYEKESDKILKLVDSPNDNSIGILNINKDANKLIYTRASMTNGVMNLTDSLYLYDIEKKEEKLLIDNQFSYYTANFLEDKIIFVATDMKKGGINEDCFIYVCDYEGKYELLSNEDFDMSFSNSIGTDARYGSNSTFRVKNDRLYFVVTEKETSKLYSIDLSFNLRLEIDNYVEDFVVSNDDIYYLKMDKESLAELTRVSDSKVLVKNKPKSDIAPIEEFTFISNGDILKGFVVLPLDFEKGKKYPTILSVHGGPKTEFSDIFHHEHQVLASDGYIVIYTNPHGSSGNGVKYSDIRGRYGEIDYDDLMKFTDLAIMKYPQIDTENMAIYGGSYGGFMTNWTIGHTDRFKAACSQRSISNWTSFYGVSDIGYYFASDQTAANPWDSLEKMWDQSPLKYADNAKTPTLFIHSDEDYRCPLEQGLQMYSKLKLNGVDTKMYIFHGENHELSRSGKPKGRIKRLTEIKNWFDRYLKNENISK